MNPENSVTYPKINGNEKFSCQQAKTFFSNIERPKRSFVTETENKVVLRKTILATKMQRRCFFCDMKLKEAQFRCQLTKTYFPSEWNLKQRVFSQKTKIAAFCDIKLEAFNLVATKPKDGFGKIKGQKRSFGRKKRKSLYSETYCWKQRNLAGKRRKRFVE